MSQTVVPTLTQSVQEYSSIDDELEVLSVKQKILRKRKQDLEAIIIKTMREKNLETRTLKQGQHHFSIGTRKQYSALSFTYLETCFEELVPDDATRCNIMEYLRENREVRNIDELRKYSH